MHIIIIRIEGIHYFTVSFFHKGPPQFAGPCEFIIICIKFLVEIDELYDSGSFREIFVGLTYLLFHQVVDFGQLRKFLITRVIDLLLVGPFTHHGIINTNDRSYIFPLVSNNP